MRITQSGYFKILFNPEARRDIESSTYQISVLSIVLVETYSRMIVYF